MIVSLIIAAEVAFWVVLGTGLGARYVLRLRRTSTVLLLCVPLIDLLLLTATAVDIERGAEPTWAHGMAALYLGFTVAYGHSVIAWADRHAAHRLGGGPKPATPKRYGWDRARQEWRVWVLTLVAVVISLAVLEGLFLVAEEPGDPDRVEPLRAAEFTALRIVGIHALVALSYTIWRKKPPAGDREVAARERAGEHGTAA
ncbi:hypothetical protein ACTWP5_13955 [Streptomyces sp. 4N509B]|uniref:hypothetical protein n=1 Tax=Streptomyces sp. 4N509B TaxID=3457413 RepID=UPI003FD4891C